MKLVEVVRVRKLPYAGTINVRVGDKVTPNQVIAKMNYFPGLVSKVNVTKTLAIKPEKLRQVITVAKGDFVEEGDLIAFSSQWHRGNAILAPHSGIIGMISKNLGIVYLRKLIKFNPNDYEEFNIETLLEVSPAFAKKYTEVKVNDRVSPGQVIALKMYKDNKLRPESIQSNMFGVVESIQNNIIKIRNRMSTSTLKAYLLGKVIGIKEDYAITIKSLAYKINGKYGLCGERTGELRVCEDNKSIKIDSHDMGKILLLKEALTEEIIRTADRHKVSAIIAASCKLSVIRRYVGNQFIPGITGAERLNTGIVLLNGFKDSKIDADIFSKLAKLDGSYASVNGTTHIRAGAIRPEILIFTQ